MEKSLPVPGIIAALGLRLFMTTVAPRHPERTAAGNDGRAYTRLADAMPRGARFIPALTGARCCPVPAGPESPPRFRIPAVPCLCAPAAARVG